jgi:hypothetical protein
LFLISLQSCLLHFFMWGIAGVCNTCPVVHCTNKWC